MQNENSFELIRLFDLLATEGGENFLNFVSGEFSSINKDVEDFFKEKAVQSTKLNTSSTYLVTSSEADFDILGYFTLATKMLTLKKESKSINGSDLMNIVLKQAKHILNLTSGKTVFVECEKIEKVVNFYIENGFHILDNESMSENKKDLIQLYRLL